MQVITDLPVDKSQCVLALGNFDGVHLGHRRLLESGLEESRRLGIKFAVLVFHPHPLQLLFPERRLKLLTTQAERLRVFETIGVDRVYLLPFTTRLADTSPEKFVEETLLKLGARHVIVGFNYSFGANGEGTPVDLQVLGQRYGFQVSVLQAQAIDGRVISSSGIRKALMQGDVSLARQMLGRYPCLCGRVVKGEQRGRTLGYPTANLLLPEELLIPKRGVYAIQACLSGKEVYGMMNIGMKPTFYAEFSTTIEIHFLDFHGDLYGHEITVDMVERLRDERKFPSVDELKRQLAKDAQHVSRVFRYNTKNTRNFTN
ncbi:MAG: bifunctional riboflavin kinase/FAD synthetase [Desulfitobacteriaceae bacterium]